MEAAETEYDTSNTLETDLATETGAYQGAVAEEVATTAEEVLAVGAEETAGAVLDVEEVAETGIYEKEEEVKEKKIEADENAANAQVIKNNLNSYYKMIVKKLEGVKFDGTQDLQILSKINTKAKAGTLFAHAFPAKWGAMWESGGDNGQGKMLFLRDGKLCFDIGWTGVV